MEQEQLNRQEDEIDLGALFYALLGRIWLIIMLALLGGAIMFVYSSNFVTPLYQSTASVFVLNRTNEENITSSDITTSTALAKDFANLATSHLVVEHVISDLNLSESYTYSKLSSNVSVSIDNDSRMLRVMVTDPDPEMAKKLADAFVAVLSDVVAERINMNLEKIDEGTLPTDPSSPNITKRTIIGCLVGALLAVAIVTIRFLLDDTIKTDKDVEKYLNLTVLAVVPQEDFAESDEKKKRKKGKERR